MFRSPNCAPHAPPGVGDVSLGDIDHPAVFGDQVASQIVALEKIPALRDVGHVDVRAAVVVQVAESHVHTAFGRLLERCAVQSLEPLALEIDEEHLGTVVVGQVQVGPAVAVEVGGADGHGPPRAVHPETLRDVFETPPAPVQEEVVAAPVVRVFETLLHDPCRRNLPQVMGFRKIPANVKIDQAIPVDVRPNRAVRVHPPVETRFAGHVLENSAALVSEQPLAAPPVYEHVLETVVVVVTPHRPHGYAAGVVHIGKAHGTGDLLEASVAQVSIHCVRRAFSAAGHVQVLPPVVVIIHHRDGRAQGRQVRHDRVECRIEFRLHVYEVYTGRRCRIREAEPVPVRIDIVRVDIG